MTTAEYLRYLQQEIHTAVAATLDDAGLPVTCAVDILDYDDDSLYFLTAKGKSFYHRLKKCGYLALTGMKGKGSRSCVSISVRGRIQEIGVEPLPRLMEKNPYMAEIYSTAESRNALTVFQLFEGSGEWFDLSQKPIQRASFTFGGGEGAEKGYFITGRCIGCGSCINRCPEDCILEGTPFVIEQQHCMHCGSCAEGCPVHAIVRRG